MVRGALLVGLRLLPIATPHLDERLPRPDPDDLRKLAESRKRLSELRERYASGPASHDEPVSDALEVRQVGPSVDTAALVLATPPVGTGAQSSVPRSATTPDPHPKRKPFDAADLKWRKRFRADGTLEVLDPPPVGRDKSPRKAEQLERERAADARWQAKARAQWDGVQGPPTMTRDIFVMSQQIVSMPGTRAVHYWLRRLRSAFSGMPFARIREACLQPQADGTCKYNWGDDCARRILAEALIQLRMSKETSKRYVCGSRSRERGRVLCGVTKECINWAVTPRWRQRRYHRNTFGGGTKTWQSDFQRLEGAKFFERKLLPVSRLRKWEIGKKHGKAITRYWIPCLPRGTDRERNKDRRRPPSKLGSVRFDEFDHKLGWDLCDEVIVRTPRRHGRLVVGGVEQMPP